MAEEDKDYAEYRWKTKGRFNLKDRHIAEGYMRGSDPVLTEASDQIDHVSGNVDIVLVMEDTGTVTSGPPAMVDAMLKDWQAELDRRKPDDPRAFTREALAQNLALFRHRDDNVAEIMASGALWLATSKDEAGADLLNVLRMGDVELRCEITFDDVSRERRFSISLTAYGKTMES